MLWHRRTVGRAHVSFVFQDVSPLAVHVLFQVFGGFPRPTTTHMLALNKLQGASPGATRTLGIKGFDSRLDWVSK